MRRLIAIWLISFCCTVLLSTFNGCSRFDQSTNLGLRILTDLDSGITDTLTDFRSYVADSSCILKSFSLPTPAIQTTFGIHVTHDSVPLSPLSMSVGNLGSETGIGYVEYTLPPQDTGSRPRIRYLSTDTARAIMFYFRADSSLTDSTLYIKFASCAEKVHRTKSDTTTILTVYDTLHIGGKTTSDSFTIDDSTQDSVLVNAVFHARTDSSHSTGINRTLGFALVSLNQSGLARIRPTPLMVLAVEVKGSIIYDTIICRYSDFSVTENNALSLTDSSISSFESGLTAVFQVSLDSLWTAMSDPISPVGYPEVARAFISLKGSQGNPEDTLLVRYRYTFSSTLYDNDSTLNSQFVKSYAVFDTGVINIEVQDSLQRFAHTTRPSSGYLYLQIITQNRTWNQVLWRKPAHFEAVLTNFK
jgi:hypothetical protein